MYVRMSLAKMISNAYVRVFDYVWVCMYICMYV